jgi:glycosyltransferase involved in cell wall biosynthesis
MQPILVSIITVCYNSAATIQDTIQSVVSQQYKDIEYLIIDGNSTDQTLEIVKKYQDGIAQIISEPDQGMYDAINKGIELSTGDIIGILNADDFYTDEQVITEVVKRFKKGICEGLYADLNYVDSKNINKVVRHWRSGSYRHGKFLYGWMPPHPTFFVKKECYEKYGKFNLGLKTAADYELMLRFIHKHKINLCYLNRTIVNMRLGGMSNVSLVNRLKANRQDRQAWKINGLKPYPFTLTFKPLRKLGQWIKKSPQT